MRLFVLILLMCFISIANGQQILGKFNCSQIIDGKMESRTYSLVYPKLASLGDNIWMQVHRDSGLAFIELTDANRKNLLQMLDIYLAIEDMLDTPKKLPAKKDIGNLQMRAGFLYQLTEPYVSKSLNAVSYFKFSKDGSRSFALYIGKIKHISGKSFDVPTISLSHDEVELLSYLLSDEKNRRYLQNRNRSVTIDSF